MNSHHFHLYRLNCFQGSSFGALGDVLNESYLKTITEFEINSSEIITCEISPLCRKDLLPGGSGWWLLVFSSCSALPQIVWSKGEWQQLLQGLQYVRPICLGQIQVPVFTELEKESEMHGENHGLKIIHKTSDVRM